MWPKSDEIKKAYRDLFIYGRNVSIKCLKRHDKYCIPYYFSFSHPFFMNAFRFRIYVTIFSNNNGSCTLMLHLTDIFKYCATLFLMRDYHLYTVKSLCNLTILCIKYEGIMTPYQKLKILCCEILTQKL